MQLIRRLRAVGLACALGCADGGAAAYSAEVLPAPPEEAPAAPETPAEEPTPVPASEVEATLAEIADARAWGDGESTAPAAFERWGRAMARLTAAEQHDDADRVADAVADLWRSWGASGGPVTGFDAFTRDRFGVRGVRVDVARYFEPVLLYPTDDRLTKSVRFSAYHGDRLVRRYYLEHDRANALFTLGRVDTRGHRTVAVYGDAMPAYRLVRAAVIADLSAVAAPPG